MEFEAVVNLLNENVEICLPEDTIAEKLQLVYQQNRKLIVKLGFAPTVSDLHSGYAVIMKKLRQFQDLGHTVIIIIGDFTA